MVLHKDISFMPKRKKAWSSWVYLSETKNDNSESVSLSYWMNNLQPIDTDIPIIVTLNPSRMPDKELIFDEYDFHHPLFDEEAIISQSKLENLQGENNTYYCGAWSRYGFHEDGLLSARNVAEKLGVQIPWK